MDGYSRALARHLAVRTADGAADGLGAHLFNVPTLCRSSLAGFRADARFVRWLRACGAELVHFPNHHLARYGVAARTPYVVTVHDLIRYFDLHGLGPFIHAPNLRDRLVLRADARGIRSADAVIAVSKTARGDLVTHLRVPEERVFVVYEGVDHGLFRPVERRLLEEPYVLFVGSEHPRKNLVALLRALALLRRRRRFRALKLVKVGAAGGCEAPFRAATVATVAQLGLTGAVVFSERVPDDDLAAYYSGAACLVLPSLFEGFGFPPLEAMACGCPAVVSTAGALPEIVGDAALAVPPHDVEALADAIATVVEEQGVRRRLIARGLRRAAQFTWTRTARETVAVYEHVLASREGRPRRPRAVREAARRG